LPVIGVIRFKRLVWARHVAGIGEMKNRFILLGTVEGKKVFGAFRRQWKDNIKMS
jgi:hypothetical protein